MVQRTRSRGTYLSPSILSQEAIHTNCSQSNWSWSFSYNTPIFASGIETMTDSVVPRFNREKEHGKVFFNPMSHSIEESMSYGGIGHMVYENSTAGCPSKGWHAEYRNEGDSFPSSVWANSLVPCGSIISDSDISSLVDEVSTRVAANRGLPENNLFESLAEYRQTVELITKPTASLWKFLRKKNTTKLRILRDKNYIASLRPDEAWLIYRYGVVPFIHDVTGVIDGLSKKIGKRRVTTRAFGKISEGSTSSASTHAVFLNMDTHYTLQTQDDVSVRGMSLDEYVASTANNVGFTTKGFLTTPWEIIPYSFVADWFITLGDFLRAGVPALGFNQLGSCVTVERNRATLYQCTGMTPLNPTQYSVTRQPTGSVLSRKWTKIRRPLSKPSVVIRNDFRLSNAVRLADSIALLSQRLLLLLRHR